MLDENEFLGPYGIRSLSRYHREHPYVLHAGGTEHRVDYRPAESDSGMFGGNSNWRGPIWMPLNYLIVESLQRFHSYYGDDFRVECPVGSGRMLNLAEVADEIALRLCRLFLPDRSGERPMFGGDPRFAAAHFRNHLLFHEYFHGDTGRGLGAAHQTGWSGLIASLLMMRAANRARAAEPLSTGRSAAAN
jgi:hypothetical protein